MTSIPTQSNKPLAKKSRFVGCKPKADMPVTPPIWSIGKWDEW
jgi:hypothetical protein